MAKLHTRGQFVGIRSIEFGDKVRDDGSVRKAGSMSVITVVVEGEAIEVPLPRNFPVAEVAKLNFGDHVNVSLDVPRNTRLGLAGLAKAAA
jgi:hypothetical protein